MGEPMDLVKFGEIEPGDGYDPEEVTRHLIRDFVALIDHERTRVAPDVLSVTEIVHRWVRLVAELLEESQKLDEELVQLTEEQQRWMELPVEGATPREILDAHRRGAQIRVKIIGWQARTEIVAQRIDEARRQCHVVQEIAGYLDRFEIIGRRAEATRRKYRTLSRLLCPALLLVGLVVAVVLEIVSGPAKALAEYVLGGRYGRVVAFVAIYGLGAAIALLCVEPVRKRLAWRLFRSLLQQLLTVTKEELPRLQERIAEYSQGPDLTRFSA